MDADVTSDEPELSNSSHGWCRLKKKVQCESCELSFIWGKMRTIAQEIASQRALRNCSKEVVGEVSILVILVKGVRAIKHTFWQKFAVSHEKQMSL